jgi:hypothetical protein
MIQRVRDKKNAAGTGNSDVLLPDVYQEFLQTLEIGNA